MTAPHTNSIPRSDQIAIVIIHRHSDAGWMVSHHSGEPDHERKSPYRDIKIYNLRLYLEPIIQKRLDEGSTDPKEWRKQVHQARAWFDKLPIQERVRLLKEYYGDVFN